MTRFVLLNYDYKQMRVNVQNNSWRFLSSSNYTIAFEIGLIDSSRNLHAARLLPISEKLFQHSRTSNPQNEPST